MSELLNLGWLCPAFHLLFDLIHFRLRDFSGGNQRADASRRQAWAGPAHAKVQSSGLQPVIAAEFLIIVGAMGLHVFGYRPRLRPGR